MLDLRDGPATSHDLQAQAGLGCRPQCNLLYPVTRFNISGINAVHHHIFLSFRSLPERGSANTRSLGRTKTAVFTPRRACHAWCGLAELPPPRFGSHCCCCPFAAQLERGCDTNDMQMEFVCSHDTASVNRAREVNPGFGIVQRAGVRTGAVCQFGSSSRIHDGPQQANKLETLLTN